MLSRVRSDLFCSYKTPVENQGVRDRDACSIGRHLGDIRGRYSMLESAKVQDDMGEASPDMDVSAIDLIIDYLATLDESD